MGLFASVLRRFWGGLFEGVSLKRGGEEARHLEGFGSCVRRKNEVGGKGRSFSMCVSVVGGRERVVSGAER